MAVPPRSLFISGAPKLKRVAFKLTAQSLVRYKTNDYSVPVYSHQDLWVRGYP
ncbi:hypothetical protein [Rhizobium tumorigenes]|uniref:Uncharacterized protein n=1 Tax=Rhizobium tumorigenes TaxID=2041385 RepID=A0AAF1K8M4_9HYPH|nr:hypothetical protein [Rhizobium tumorigenes]WFR98158.1 hypothetical protein PR017_20605 [Rhizobium tumorigenes]WFS03679.1 hypothetical protein PR016_21350 [Rhizobium tumorigenes]